MMGIFSSTPTLDSMETLLIDQMEDLYDAEQRLVKALPKMANAAHDPNLKSVIQGHLRETEGQVSRLERAFSLLGRSAKAKTCEAMKGLVSEGEEYINASGDPNVKDAALIATAQRVEHYEIAGYGCARAFAQRLGRTEVARLLEETLQEEKGADQKLNRLAESEVNTRTPAMAGSK
jgi:ferritin-like metal-binding protein YciE